MEKKFDKCVMCGKDTGYEVSYPIDLRHGYIEGAGQTCPGGCKKTEEEVINEEVPEIKIERIIGIPEEYFKNSPNDFDFAKKVRTYYYENYVKQR